MPALDAGGLAPGARRNHGVDNACARSAISSWACGLPLALVLGAAAWIEHGAAAIQPGGAVLAATADDLVGHLSGLALDQLDTELLEVAAVAGWVDDRLLADVMPERDCHDALATLASYSFVERSGCGVTLHPLVAHAVAERVRHDGRRISDLVLRIASHLRDRAILGDARALHQLAALSEDPKLRAGMAPAHSATLYGDDVRVGEADEIVALGSRGDGGRRTTVAAAAARLLVADADPGGAAHRRAGRRRGGRDAARRRQPPWSAPRTRGPSWSRRCSTTPPATGGTTGS